MPKTKELSEWVFFMRLPFLQLDTQMILKRQNRTNFMSSSPCGITFLWTKELCELWQWIYIKVVSYNTTQYSNIFFLNYIEEYKTKYVYRNEVTRITRRVSKWISFQREWKKRGVFKKKNKNWRILCKVAKKKTVSSR